MVSRLNAFVDVPKKIIQDYFLLKDAKSENYDMQNNFARQVNRHAHIWDSCFKDL